MWLCRNGKNNSRLSYTIKLEYIQKHAILPWIFVVNTINKERKWTERFLEKVNFLKINKRRGSNKVRGLAKIEKFINGRGTLIWHMGVHEVWYLNVEIINFFKNSSLFCFYTMLKVQLRELAADEGLPLFKLWIGPSTILLSSEYRNITVVITSASLITIIFGVVFKAEMSKHRKKQCEHEFEFWACGAHSHSHFALDVTFLVFKNVSMPVNTVNEIFLEIGKNDDFVHLVLHSLIDCIWLGIYLFIARASFPKTYLVLFQAAPWSAHVQTGSLDILSPFLIHPQNIEF